MATKSTRGNATRRRIVEQSAAVFNKHGYSGTSMSALMSATGLEKGGIYRHFESKEDLAAAAFDYAWETAVERRGRGLEDCASSLERLLLLVRNFVAPPQRAIPGGCPLLNTAIENDDGNEVLRERARGALDEWRSGIVEIVCQGIRAGELRKDVDPVAVATIVISGLEGAIMFSRLENSREALFTIGGHLEGYLRSLSRGD
jgi:TetR/AcrR family transcriptional repressor of nem operon